MRLDTVNALKALAKQLLCFFNELWGGTEAAASDLFGEPSFADRSDTDLSDLEASTVLRVFIENYDVIAARAGWRSQSLLACAIAAEAWTQHSGKQDEELLALLSVRRLLDATAVIAEVDDLSVISLQVQVDDRLGEFGLSVEVL